MKTRLFLIVLAASLWPSLSYAAAVTGTFAYPAGFVPPPGATLEVEIVDEFAGDAPNVIAHVETAAPASSGKFSVDYEPKRIQGNHPYVLSVVVKSAGQFLLYAPQKYPVLTQGGGSQVTVALATVPLQPEVKPYGPAFEETYWKLLAVGGVPVAGGYAREPYIRLNAFNHNMSGTGGCHTFVGGYSSTGNTVLFQDVAPTRQACPAASNQDDALLKALQAARGWKIQDDRMALVDAQGTVLANFQGIPPQPVIGTK